MRVMGNSLSCKREYRGGARQRSLGYLGGTDERPLAPVAREPRYYGPLGRRI
jgi:hypothetical protein